MKVFTIGFTKKSAEQFFCILKRAAVQRLLDVRLNKVSQLAGFAKRDDLRFFLREICAIEYVHATNLAPTQDILDAYKKHGGDWSVYEARFLSLLSSRRVESETPRELIANSCLLCSEDKPDQCHRRLVAEYLSRHWGNLEIEHLV